jgi:hypothetical protein
MAAVTEEYHGIGIQVMVFVRFEHDHVDHSFSGRLASTFYTILLSRAVLTAERRALVATRELLGASLHSISQEL